MCDESCGTEDGWGFPHCTISDSLIKTYTMMLGEVGDASRYQQKLFAQILLIAFIFLVVILLSNVLIAMVTDSHSYIKNERAEIVFWSNRLDFVAEMETIVVIRQNILSTMSCKSQDHDYTSTSTDPRGDVHKRCTREPCLQRTWNKMISLIKGESVSEDTAFVEMILYSLLRFFAAVIFLPLWIALGILTAGCLFPPQVRQWLFIKKETQNVVLNSANEIEDAIDKLKKEVSSSRSETKKELQTMRQDCHNLRDEVEEMKRSIEEELVIVKKVTNALLRTCARQRV